MKVICAGFPKTGTKSISKALRDLGFTVFDWEEQAFDFLDHWVDVLQMAPNQMLNGFTRMPTLLWICPGTFSSRKHWKLFLSVK